MDEELIIARVLAGHAGEFRAVVERYQHPMLRYCGDILADPTEAEDCVQEAFVSAYRALGTYDSARGAFSTWLYRIARNEAFSRLRQAELRPAPAAAAPEPDGQPQREQADRSRLDPAEAADMHDVFRALDHALNNLPPEIRSTYLAVEREGLSYADAAAVEAVPVGTVRSRVARARERLRETLATLQHEPELEPEPEPEPKPEAEQETAEPSP